VFDSGDNISLLTISPPLALILSSILLFHFFLGGELTYNVKVLEGNQSCISNYC